MFTFRFSDLEENIFESLYRALQTKIIALFVQSLSQNDALQEEMDVTHVTYPDLKTLESVTSELERYGRMRGEWRGSSYLQLSETVESFFPIVILQKMCEVLSLVSVPECEGCFLREPGQSSHMTCPYGCLHDPNMCEECDRK
jgi:hypothetical protein